MKKHILLITLPLLLLLVLVWTDSLSGMVSQQESSETFASINFTNEKEGSYDKTSDHVLSSKSPKEDFVPAGEANKQESIISYAMSFLGTPYIYAGMSPQGFDCSGFITYVYRNFDVELPHSSAMQAEEGKPIPKDEARTGDLVIFTGTNPDIREPGHVGIVISSPGDTIEFVHSSSNGGVKVSKVQGTRYDTRFLEIRRVL
ncbi:C40 family peptidase [Pontibacter locisalis]|uniref:C40 family peptidase n=1 Tax=Pontibacter locisalis TaxID=1719035 RepID=A0ABW5IQX2_9BACT